jgi:predicted hydrocarbon binding protein
MFKIREIQEEIIYKSVKNMSNERIAHKVVYNSNEDNATWVRNTMRRLEENFDFSTLKLIRMNCQCGYKMDEKLQLLRQLINSSSSLEDLVNHKDAIDAGLYYIKGNLYLQFLYCPCPMLAEVDKIETNTWCQCTTGYSKVLFEKAFNCKVEVDLLKSVKMGDEICLMKINFSERLKF